MFSKIIFALLIVAAVARPDKPSRGYGYEPPQPSYKPPQPSYKPPQPSYKPPQPSYSPPDSSEEEEMPLMPFNYGYEVRDNEYGTDFSHNTDSDGEVVQGEYRVALPDGRTQIVKYEVTKEGGYVAEVSYEGEAREYVPPAPKSSGDSSEEDGYKLPQPSYKAPQRTYGSNY